MEYYKIICNDPIYKNRCFNIQYIHGDECIGHVKLWDNVVIINGQITYGCVKEAKMAIILLRYNGIRKLHLSKHKIVSC